MDKRILVVEHVFHLHGRGVLLLPFVSFDAFPQPPKIPFRRTVTLRRPEGTTASVEAMFTISTSIPVDRMGYDCLLLAIEKADVPVGTEVWVTE